MTPTALDLIRRSGWTPGRTVSVDGAIDQLLSAGHVIVPHFPGLLSEFSGLVICSEDGRTSLTIDALRAATQATPGWCEAYARGIGKSVTPFGTQGHSVLMIDEAGSVWGAFDDLYGFMGDDIVTAVTWTLVEPPRMHMFDRIAPD